MKQVAVVLEIPRDLSYSRLYECQHVFPIAGSYNFIVVYEKVFLAIDDSLVAAIKREVENEH